VPCRFALQSGKAGGFIDRRFGESDPTLDADDKALRRLQRLRQKQLGKGGRFALGGTFMRYSSTRLGVLTWIFHR